VHPAVLAVAGEHDKLFEGTPPRTWTYVSDLLHALDDQCAENMPLVRHALGGYLPQAWVLAVLKALDNCRHEGCRLGAHRLLREYDTNKELQQHVKAAREEGRTDRLEQISNEVFAFMQGAGFNILVANQEFSLAAFERLLEDLPGDHREFLQKAFAEKPLSAALLGFRPEDVLKNFANSAAAKVVRKWSCNERLRYRLDVLVRALVRHIDGRSDLASLRNNRGAMIGLGAFLGLLPPRLAQPLKALCEQRHIEPVFPLAGRRAQ